MDNETVALARRHVVEGRRIVERQQQLVRELMSSGRSVTDAERTLDLFENTLAIKQHLRDLTKGSG
jgi:flagellar biosynthesis/type III secretory pathway chaperone